MRDERDTRGKKLRASRLDEHLLAVIGAREAEAMVRALAVVVLLLGLRNRGTERDVPRGGRLGLIGLAVLQMREECLLAHCARIVVDGLVTQVPIHRKAEGSECVLEGLLIFRCELEAQLDEVLAADRQLVLRLRGLRVAAAVGRFEVLHVGEARIAAHAEVVLHAALRGQAVVVPAHRVEHVLADHAVLAREDVGLGVREHVTDVQRARGCGRGSVDREDLLAARLAVERVDLRAFPLGIPLALETIEARAIGDCGGHRLGGRVVTCVVAVFAHALIVSRMHASVVLRGREMPQREALKSSVSRWALCAR